MPDPTKLMVMLWSGRFRPPRGDKRLVLPLDGDAECPGVAFLFGVGLAQYGRSSYVQRIYACRWQVYRVERECLAVHDKPGVIYRVCGHKAVQVTVLRPDGKHRVGSQDGRVLHHVPVGQILIKGGGVSEHVFHVGDRRDIPGVEGLVEGLGVEEHLVHVCDRGDIPVGEGAVKGDSVEEHG